MRQVSGPHLRVAVLALIAVAVLSACLSSAPSPAPLPASPVPNTSAPSSASSESVDPAALVQQYVSALARGDYDTAWSMLGAESQAGYSSFDDYVSERAAFMASAAGRFAVEPPRTDPAELAQWLPNTGGASIDPARAFLVQVDYPQLANTNSGFELYIVARDASGAWRLWNVR